MTKELLLFTLLPTKPRGIFIFSNPTYKTKVILQLKGDQTTSTNGFDWLMKNKEQ
jgi:hypothetical protein